jgi:hypothetical protein
MPVRYFVSLPDPARAQNAGSHAFASHGAEGMAAELQDALRSDALFERWRLAQEEPDAVDPALGATDPAATVHGEQRDLRFELIVVTSLPGAVFRHRMQLLAGNAWELRDVSAA